ncbi:MAG TPA: cell wall hydrolase [Gemmataceae bacterium]|nr:cell wall hydrolase [Gemmataceae bacterium]
MPLAPTFDIEMAARTCWMESRGEGQAGMQAVAWAIVNRHDKGKWYSGHTIAECCLMPFQFSCWNTNDVNRVEVARLPDNDTVLDMCRHYVQAAMLYAGPDPTDGATHYVADTIPLPDWAAKATQTAHIGNHLFFKDVK